MTDDGLDRCMDCCKRIGADDDVKAFFLSRRCESCRARKAARDAARAEQFEAVYRWIRPKREPL
jgi:hypothetical protein